MCHCVTVNVSGTKNEMKKTRGHSSGGGRQNKQVDKIISGSDKFYKRKEK